MNATFASPLVGLINSLLPFSLQNLKDFPFTDWTTQQEIYSILEGWYKGDFLNAVTVEKNTGKKIEKYPIKINPIAGTCAKHAAAVMGQSVDSIRFGGLPFQMIPDLPRGKKKIAKTIQDALMKVFVKNAVGASFLTNCINAQYLGGSVICAKWIPGEKRIEISTPSPKEFFGLPDGTNYWRLREGWIIKEITESDAKAYGYVPRFNESKFQYIEYWSKTTYKIMINGVVLKWPGTEIPQEGTNPFGRVPMVYIPHIRTNGFLGDSIITETVKGVIREMNLRMADIGDAVSEDSHGYTFIRNVRGSVATVYLGDGRPVLNLGSGSGIGNDSQPDLKTASTTSASEPMVKFTSDLYQIYRREVNHPAVADGEDEGSQRSSLTLAVRMAPLVSEAEMERLFYSVGLNEFAGILLIMMQKKGLFEITEEMLDTDFLIQWNSMLPRDREALTTEVAVRSKNKLGSNKHLMGLFGDIQDTDEELAQIRQEKDLAEKSQPSGQGNPNANPNAKEKTKDDPNKI